MSFSQNIQHIVFGTKYREQTIPIEQEKTLYSMLFSLLKQKKCYVYRIGGMPDHVHILVDVPTNISISDLMKYIKTISSKELLANPLFPHWRGWGESYCSLSKSNSDVETVINYIKNQKEHHNLSPFIEEYRQLLIAAGISPDSPYFPK